MATNTLSVTQKRNNVRLDENDISGIPASDVSFCTSEDVLVVKGKKPKPLFFQYVNPALLLQWQGEFNKQTNQISGSGTFRAYERSKDGNHKAKLILSLEASRWKDGKPNGEIKMTQVFFYDGSDRSDNIVKQVRKFVGIMENMKRQGYGQYSIQYYYSNQTKEIVEVKGNWSKDFINTATVIENGKIRDNVKFSNNVQVDANPKNKSTCRIEAFDGTGQKKNSSRIILNPLLSNSAPKFPPFDQERPHQTARIQVENINYDINKNEKSLNNNMLAPPSNKIKGNHKNAK